MNLSGIYPPIATPFKNDDVDYAGLKHNVQRWMQTGLRGVARALRRTARIP